jgi:DNA (cytosine-5)-methyltransferase 1
MQVKILLQRIKIIFVTMYNVDKYGYFMEKYYSIAEVADLLSVSKETLRRWDRNGKLKAVREPMSNYRVYRKDQLRIFDSLDFLFAPTSENENEASPNKDFNAIELFAGAGGLAIGLEKAGIINAWPLMNMIIGLAKL